MRRSKVVTVSIPPRVLNDTEKLAKREKRTKSEVMREPLRLYLDLQNDRSFRQSVRKRAVALKIASDEDIERLVDSSRR